ncbi:hypothetical protein DKX38_002696 [Salix brachista]|uniref:C2HC zinc finger plants domain-containing protein n=1 Tax=Salix brachista TaxID=2182728 RepID=A0A5N5NQ88_9ROSI|nr:hypothetical protein DKX38_002696 [Salix brachista]
MGWELVIMGEGVTMGSSGGAGIEGEGVTIGSVIKASLEMEMCPKRKCHKSHSGHIAMSASWGICISKLETTFKRMARKLTIRIAQPLQDEQTPLNVGDQSPSAVPDVNVNSILAETGRAQFMLDVFSDGSSFICLKCGGLVMLPDMLDLHTAFPIYCIELHGVCAQIPRDSPETRHRERENPRQHLSPCVS